MLPNLAQRTDIHRRMQTAAAAMRLPFRNRVWRGQSGGWLGAGTGSSIDFQDHRPYLPGDDPRHIDWQAYARTGNYTMKLYREEVSPTVDLVLDVSASMFLNAAKTTRTLELFYFCIESALRSGAALHCYALDRAALRRLAIEEALAGEDFFVARENGAPLLHQVPWRQGSLRVVISDLLFPGSAADTLTPLSTSKGRGLIFAPRTTEESQPDWNGNVQITDCETRRDRVQLVTANLRARYMAAYERHFALWRDQARKHAVAIARVESELDFRDALHAEALPVGAVELA